MESKVNALKQMDGNWGERVNRMNDGGLGRGKYKALPRKIASYFGNCLAWEDPLVETCETRKLSFYP